MAYAGFEQGDCTNGGPQDNTSLPPLLRVQKCALSTNMFERQIVPTIILDLFENAAPDALTNDLPHIMKLFLSVADESMLKLGVLEQVPHLAAQAIECTSRCAALKSIISDYLIPLVLWNLGTSDASADKVAHSTLIHLVEQGYITKLQAEIQVCPSILALTKVDNHIDVTTSAVTLMSKLAPLLGRDITERVFLSRFSELCSNPVLYVRKATATHLADFCAVCGPAVFERTLLPCFIALCADEAWAVRASCAYAATFVSCACPPGLRKTVLAPAFTELLKDSCRGVQMVAYQTLGQFISTFADPPITNFGFNCQGKMVLFHEGTEYFISMPTFPDNRTIAVPSEASADASQPTSETNSINSNESGTDADLSMLEVEENKVTNGVADIKIHTDDDDIDSNNFNSSCSNGANELKANGDVHNINIESDENKSTTNTICETQQHLDEEHLLENDLNCTETSDEFIKEIVETVKNAVISYRKEEVEQGFIGDKNKKINKLETIPLSSSTAMSPLNIIGDDDKKSLPQEPNNNIEGKTELLQSFTTDQKIKTTTKELQIEKHKVNNESEIISSNKIVDDSCKFRDTSDITKEECGETSENSKIEVIHKTSSTTACCNKSKMTIEDDVSCYNSYNYWYLSPDNNLLCDFVVDVDNNLPLEANGSNKRQQSPSLPVSGMWFEFRGNEVITNYDSVCKNNLFKERRSDASGKTLEQLYSMITFTHYEKSLRRSHDVSENNLEDSQSYSSESNSTKYSISSNSPKRVESPPPLPTQDIVPQELIDCFSWMMDEPVSIVHEITYYCAYSLPAVALTLGPENWPILHKTLQQLCHDYQYKVRRTVAFSLHELAGILGIEMATKYLTPFMDNFIKDLDEVRIGVLKHYVTFLNRISRRKHLVYLKKLEILLEPHAESTWRFREEIVLQLIMAIPLFKPVHVAKIIGNMVQQLMCDKVAAVREKSIELASTMVNYVCEEPSLNTGLLTKFAEKLAHSKFWRRRQTYGLLCCRLLSDNALPLDQFSSEVLPHLLDLSWDAVANVRIVVARCLAENMLSKDYFSDPEGEHYSSINSVLRRLQADKDSDVRRFSGSPQ